jgi:ATP-dependent exoDNAse (exonuclease V) beta subunit
MTPGLFAFICKVMQDNITPFSLLLLGDERQSIYEFKHADSRYLTLSAKVFKTVNPKPWKELSLRTSFR